MLYETSLRPHAYGRVADLYNLQNVLRNKPAPNEVNGVLMNLQYLRFQTEVFFCTDKKINNCAMLHWIIGVFSPKSIASRGDYPCDIVTRGTAVQEGSVYETPSWKWYLAQINCVEFFEQGRW